MNHGEKKHIIPDKWKYGHFFKRCFKMKTGLIHLIIMVFMSAFHIQAAFCQIITEGNQEIEDLYLVNLLETIDKNTSYNEYFEKIAHSIDSLYIDAGYFLGGVDSIKIMDSDSSMLKIYITEGIRAMFGNFAVQEFSGHIPDNIYRSAYFPAGQLWSREALENAIDQILLYYKNAGYPLCRIYVGIDSIRWQNNKPIADVSFRPDPGEKVYIRSISISGNSLTRDNVIIRETRLKTGDIYRQSRVNRIKEKLQKMELFESVESVETLFTPDGADIHISVKEGHANTFDGIIGYIPARNERESGTVTGRIHILFKNLFGSGRFLEAYWEKKDAWSQIMRLGFTEPWIAGFPVDAGFSFEQEVRDTSYIERDLAFSFQYNPSSVFGIRFQAGQNTVLPDSLQSLLMQLPESSSWHFKAGFIYNTITDILNPVNGIRYETHVQFGKKQNRGDLSLFELPWEKSVNTRRIEAHIEAARMIINPLYVLYASMHGIEVRSGDPFVTVSDKIRIGGTRSIRGYYEDAFSGDTAAWANFEFRYILGYRSRFFIFTDIGWIQNRELNESDSSVFKYGYGFGIRINTPLGVMGIDYGIGENDSFLNGKLHIGIANQF